MNTSENVNEMELEMDENEEQRQTVWENEEQVLRNLDSWASSNE